MKPFITFLAIVFVLPIAAKKPIFDSIKTYETATIQYKKKTQGLYDEKNKRYLVPLSNVEIYELAKGFYGIADPKTKQVQIIFHNEYYTFKTSWQKKQMVLDKSAEFEYAGIFPTSNFNALQMEEVIITDGGKGFVTKQHLSANKPTRGFAGLYYTTNELVVLSNNQKWNTIDYCNKSHITNIMVIKKSKKNIQIFNKKYNEFYVDSSNIFMANYQLDSNEITENYSNEYEESLSRNYKEYTFRLVDLKKVGLRTNKELAIDHKDTLENLFKNSQYWDIASFFNTSYESDLLIEIDKKSSQKKLMIETTIDIKIFNVDTKKILIESGNGSKYVFEIDSSKTIQSRNINNEMDIAIRYVDNENVLLSWYVYGLGQNLGVWNLASQKWAITPSENSLWYFENYFIQEKYNRKDDVEHFFDGYIIFDMNGNKIKELDNKVEQKELFNTFLKVDSLIILDNFIVTFKNGKKGLIKNQNLGFDPVRIFKEEFDEISVGAHSDLLITIKDTNVNFIKLHNSYNTLENHLIHYDINAQKLGFSIYPQDYMGGDFNLSNMNLIHITNSSQKQNNPVDFIWSGHNFGFEKDQNGNYIIHNIKIKEIFQVHIYSEYGEETDLNGDGIADFEEQIYPNISKSGVYSTNLKKWIISPKNNCIKEYNGNYLVSSNSKEGSIVYSLYNSKGEFIASLFEKDTFEKDDLQLLYSADSIAYLNNSIYAVFSKNDHYIIESDIINPEFNIHQLYKNEYLMYNLNNNFNMEDLFLCKNERGYFYNWKNHQEKLDSIMPINQDHHILLSNRDGYYNYVYLGDTLRYSFEEKSPTELIEFLYSEKSYSSKLGKIKLNTTHSMIINFSESYFDQFEIYDDFGNPIIQYIENKGTFATGIYNDQSNKWEILPQYEKIIPTVSGYTAIKRLDKFFIEDSNNDGYSETRISKTNTYDFYDQNFKLVNQFNEDSNPYENPKNLKHFVSNLDYDTIYELVNEHLGENTIYARQMANSKHYIYHKKGKGYGSLSHWTDNNTFTKSKNYFEAINYNPYFDCAIGVRSDSLFINDFKLKLTPETTIEIMDNGGRNYHFSIRENTPSGIFNYIFNEETKNWTKQVEAVESSFGVVDGIYMSAIASIAVYADEIVINQLYRTIEEVLEVDYYDYRDYNEYNSISYNGKIANDEVWKKVNGQWKSILNEGTITKYDMGYILIKPSLSQTYYNTITKETSQLVDNQLKPLTYGKYINPTAYYTLEKGYYYIEFKGENDTSRKVVCFSPSGKVISDTFNWYEIENGKIKGTFMVMDEMGEVIEERIDYFEMTE